MFMAVLVVCLVVGVAIINWAELGQRVSGRGRWLLWGWPLLGFVVWVLAQEFMRWHSAMALGLLLLTLAIGAIHLRRTYPSLRHRTQHKEPVHLRKRRKRRRG